jgi:hypothetical protein
VTVFVDDMRAPYGRMVMCHMMAADLTELHAMAELIGVRRKWFQGDHYDICLSKRKRAVEAGAEEVTGRQMAMMRRARREMAKRAEVK